jgi:hypothetical protein
MENYKSTYAGSQIDTAIGRALPGGEIDQLRHTRNLLDNWDFRNSVNQRAQTSYTSGYAIDRWLLTGTATLTANNGHITVSGGSGGGSLRLIIETELEQAIYTLSFNVSAVSGNVNLVLQKNGGDYDTPVTKPLSVGIVSGSGTPNASARYIAVVEFGANASVDLVSAKLELGSVSTLANDPPADCGIELLKCQRYFQTFKTQSLRPTDYRDFRPIMRTNPVLSTITVGADRLYTASADL